MIKFVYTGIIASLRQKLCCIIGGVDGSFIDTDIRYIWTHPVVHLREAHREDLWRAPYDKLFTLLDLFPFFFSLFFPSTIRLRPYAEF